MQLYAAYCRARPVGYRVGPTIRLAPAATGYELNGLKVKPFKVWSDLPSESMVPNLSQERRWDCPMKGQKNTPPQPELGW